VLLFIVLAYIGGVLTILSPCILPVVPFVFARADRPFVQSTLPLLLGMVLSFAAIASLASAGGAWVVAANQWGRDIALLVLAVFALTLLSPRLAELMTRPLVRAGSHLSSCARQREGIAGPFLLGIATGLLWAPCAGPILGLVLTGSALAHAPLLRLGLLVAYGLGAATSLAVVLRVGQGVLARLKGSLGVEEWLRKGLGVVILAATVAIALGLDQRLLTQVGQARNTAIEEHLLTFLRPQPTTASAATLLSDAARYPDQGPIPALPAADTWVHHAPITAQTIAGHVVLVDFWTYSCINCLRTLPYVRAWDAQYRRDGLIVIGVHTPEFAFEHDRENVARAIHEYHIAYPVALDNDQRVWNAFANEYWPAEYLIDRHGHLRYHAFGEGHEAETETAIRTLLQENAAPLADRMVEVHAHGVTLSADDSDDRSPETYLGADRRANGVGALPASALHGDAHLALNAWGLVGSWQTLPERIESRQGRAAILFRFHARDAHLVLAPPANGTPIPFVLSLDGHSVGDSGGVDAPHGRGLVTTQRLYQLIRQHGVIDDHTLTIEFLRPGVRAYAFTFG